LAARGLTQPERGRLHSRSAQRSWYRPSRVTSMTAAAPYVSIHNNIEAHVPNGLAPVDSSDSVSLKRGRCQSLAGNGLASLSDSATVPTLNVPAPDLVTKHLCSDLVDVALAHHVAVGERRSQRGVAGDGGADRHRHCHVKLVEIAQWRCWLWSCIDGSAWGYWHFRRQHRAQ
jgi:hypothetical protein